MEFQKLTKLPNWNTLSNMLWMHGQPSKHGQVCCKCMGNPPSMVKLVANAWATFKAWSKSSVNVWSMQRECIIKPIHCQVRMHCQHYQMQMHCQMWPDLAKPSVWDFIKKSRSLHRSLVWPLNWSPSKFETARMRSCEVMSAFMRLRWNYLIREITPQTRCYARHVQSPYTIRIRTRAHCALRNVTWQSADFDVSKWSIAKDREERQPARNQANGRTR